MKISFIATVFNEEENINKLLDSLMIQTKSPDEVIIVDGGSSDATISKIKKHKLRNKNKFKFSIITKKGNRSVGRNEAIKCATGDIIVCSDAGCMLDRDWVKNITSPFSDKNVDIVSGYYKGKSVNVFQKCLTAYALVMPDRVDPDQFLPSARSMAFRKSVWKKAGEFPVKYSDNEDFVFANILKKNGANFYFKKNAIAYWIPRKNFWSAFVMFYRFARGDVEAKIFRPKASIIFVRYIIGFFILILGIIRKESLYFYILAILVFVYILYSIFKNYKYVREPKAVLILPMLQIVSDAAVLTGTISGFIKLWVTQKMQ